jgi:hypothetical protein
MAPATIPETNFLVEKYEQKLAAVWKSEPRQKQVMPLAEIHTGKLVQGDLPP